jgi:phytoene synthase
MRDEAPGHLVADVRRHDRARFLAALFAPEPARGHLVALYAFNLEIAKVRAVVSNPMLGEIRLQWWRDALDEIEAGAPPRAHDVVLALAAAIRAAGLPRAEFDRLIDARGRDLDEAPPPTLRDLTDYATATGGTLACLAVRTLGVVDASARDAARDVGTAWALAGILRATAHLAGEGRTLLPADLLAAEGVSVADVVAGRASPGLARVVARVAGEAARHLAAARTRRSRVPAAARPALAMAPMIDRGLARLAACGHDPFAYREPAPWEAPVRIALAAFSGRY